MGYPGRGAAEVEGSGRSKAQLIVGIDFVSTRLLPSDGDGRGGMGSEIETNTMVFSFGRRVRLSRASRLLLRQIQKRKRT